MRHTPFGQPVFQTRSYSIGGWLKRYFPTLPAKRIFPVNALSRWDRLWDSYERAAFFAYHRRAARRRDIRGAILCGFYRGKFSRFD